MIELTDSREDLRFSNNTKMSIKNRKKKIVEIESKLMLNYEIVNRTVKLICKKNCRSEI